MTSVPGQCSDPLILCTTAQYLIHIVYSTSPLQDSLPLPLPLHLQLGMGHMPSAAPVEEAEERPPHDELGHDAQVGRLGAGAHKEDHVRVLHPLRDGHLLPELLQQHGSGLHLAARRVMVIVHRA